jgi:hypothetical protein
MKAAVEKRLATLEQAMVPSEPIRILRRIINPDRTLPLVCREKRRRTVSFLPTGYLARQTRDSKNAFLLNSGGKTMSKHNKRVSGCDGEPMGLTEILKDIPQ